MTDQERTRWTKLVADGLRGEDRAGDPRSGSVVELRRAKARPLSLFALLAFAIPGMAATPTAGNRGGTAALTPDPDRRCRGSPS